MLEEVDAIFCVGFANQWRILMLRKMFLVLMFLPILSFAETSLGERLVRGLWSDVNKQYFHKIKENTSQEFQSIVEGKVCNRFKELDLLKHLDGKYKCISDVQATQGENLIVVTYTMVFFPKETQEEPQPVQCFSVWKKLEGNWKWVAHTETYLRAP